MHIFMVSKGIYKIIFNSCFLAYTLPVIGNLFSFFWPCWETVYTTSSFSGVLLVCERGLLLSNLLYDPEQAGHVQLVACSPLLLTQGLDLPFQ